MYTADGSVGIITLRLPYVYCQIKQMSTWFLKSGICAWEKENTDASSMRLGKTHNSDFELKASL